METLSLVSGTVQYFLIISPSNPPLGITNPPVQGIEVDFFPWGKAAVG
jgi:hypothetical protein